MCRCRHHSGLRLVRRCAVARRSASPWRRRAPTPSRCATPAAQRRRSTIASRIVSIGGAVTEILYALGLERPRRRGRHHEPLSAAGAAARSRTSATCARCRPKACSGSVRRSSSPIDGAGPEGDDRGAATRRAFRSCSCPTISPARASSRRSASSRRRPARAARGECLAAGGRGRSRRACASCAAQSTQPLRVLFVLSFVNDRPMVAGRDTAADGIIRLAGAVNAIDDYRGLQASSATRRSIAARPDVVLAMQRSSDNLDAATVFAHAGLRAHAGGRAAKRSSRWTGSICSASARAPRSPRAISPRALYPALGARARCPPSARRASVPG